jgi:hypothetical protein
MKLLDSQGKTIHNSEDIEHGYQLVPLLDDIVLSGLESGEGFVILKPDNTTMGTPLEIQLTSLHAGAACGYPFGHSYRTNSCYRLHVESLVPFKYRTNWLTQSQKVYDISRGSSYYARTGNEYTKGDDRTLSGVFEKSGKLVCKYLMSTYEYLISEAKFCLIDGKEMLLVLRPNENTVHVVDYMDGGRLVRHLDTGDIKLNNPKVLYTDYDKHVWIGCDGGKVVVVDL